MADKSTAADHGEDAQLVSFLELGIKGAMPGGDHGHADGRLIDAEGIDYPGHCRPVRVVPLLLDKAAIAKEGE